jgi:cytochrome P450
MDNHTTVDLVRDDRGVLFDTHDEIASTGWTTEEPYPKLLQLLDEGAPVREGALEDLMGQPPQYGRMFTDRGAYSVLSFEHVNQAFMDNETFSNRVYDTLTKSRLGDTLLNMDGARHTRMRDIAKPYFKPSFTQSWWNDNWIVQAVDELFTRFAGRGEAELNLELCAPLPMSVVSAGFGIARDEALPLRKAVHEVTAQHSPDSVAAANAEIARIMTQVIADRRANPRDDLISRMVHDDLALEDGSTRKLTDDEVLRYCLLIVFAGGGTTWRQLGITIMALLNDPAQMEALRSDRGLLRQAIQESTRWYPTDPVFLRMVEKDTELGGVSMKAGSIAYLCVATANRDRSQWDRPDEFDIRRPIRRHFAFGAGQHACLGQHLSRQEMEVALNAVLDRLPNLRWDAEKPAAQMTGGTLVARGPDALHVRFDPK